MKEYILSIVCVSIIGSIVSMLAPEGEGGGLGKHTRLVFGLCLVIVCLYPIKNVIIYLDELNIEGKLEVPSQDQNEIESIFDSSYSAAEADNLKSGIKALLSDRFGVDMSECKVSVRFKKSDPAGGIVGEKQQLERIFITLYGSAIWKDTGQIEEYFSSIFNCEVVTAIG